MTFDSRLILSEKERKALWEQIAEAIELYRRKVPELAVAARWELTQIRAALREFSFEKTSSPAQVVDFVVKAMTQGQLATSHPAYFGVFNPAPATMGIAGEWLAAAFNPQLASFTSAPFAIELEQHLLREFGQWFGMENGEGTFTTGGTEANQTALLTALTKHFPSFGTGGVRSLPRKPLIYVSGETHHSILKAAKLCGLGTEAVREIPARRDLRFDGEALQSQLERDRAAGHDPFFLVATAGTTNAGTVDPIEELALIARAHKLWLHLDAAWGGAVAILPEMKTLFRGAEKVDSVTLDAHKWLAAPMTAGMFLTRHTGLLEKTFRVDNTFYMPVTSRDTAVAQPYAQSMSWSRRFNGLKVFLTLAVCGWEGYRELFRRQIALGERLKQKLRKCDWDVVNQTELPVACFRAAPMMDYEWLATHVGRSGISWVTTTRLSHFGTTLRAGITNFNTTEADLETLLMALDLARKSWVANAKN